jgi:methionyl-tRNA formyltransferase
MKIILFAVPGLGEACLNQLVAHDAAPTFVVPPGSGDINRETIIKASHRHDIPVVIFDHQPNGERFVERIRELAPDLILVAGFPHLIPEHVYSNARVAAINVHPSLLPEYRGANPFYHVIANGEKETGVTLHLLDSGFDTGDILAQSKIPILPRDTMGTLIKRLAQLAADEMVILVETIKQTGLPKATKQKAKARFKANRITHWDIDWAIPAMLIDQRIRALNPYYRANTRLSTIPITISSGTSSKASIDSPSGKVIAIDTAGVHVSTGEGVYCITALSIDSQWRGDAVGAADNKLICIGDQLG